MFLNQLNSTLLLHVYSNSSTLSKSQQSRYNWIDIEPFIEQWLNGLPDIIKLCRLLTIGKNLCNLTISYFQLVMILLHNTTATGIAYLIEETKWFNFLLQYTNSILPEQDITKLFQTNQHITWCNRAIMINKTQFILILKSLLSSSQKANPFLYYLSLYTFYEFSYRNGHFYDAMQSLVMLHESIKTDYIQTLKHIYETTSSLYDPETFITSTTKKHIISDYNMIKQDYYHEILQLKQLSTFYILVQIKLLDLKMVFTTFLALTFENVDYFINTETIQGENKQRQKDENNNIKNISQRGGIDELLPTLTFDLHICSSLSLPLSFHIKPPTSNKSPLQLSTTTTTTTQKQSSLSLLKQVQNGYFYLTSSNKITTQQATNLLSIQNQCISRDFLTSSLHHYAQSILTNTISDISLDQTLNTIIQHYLTSPTLSNHPQINPSQNRVISSLTSSITLLNYENVDRNQHDLHIYRDISSQNINPCYTNVESADTSSLPRSILLPSLVHKFPRDATLTNAIYLSISFDTIYKIHLNHTTSRKHRYQHYTTTILSQFHSLFDEITPNNNNNNNNNNQNYHLSLLPSQNPTQTDTTISNNQQDNFNFIHDIIPIDALSMAPKVSQEMIEYYFNFQPYSTQSLQQHDQSFYNIFKDLINNENNNENNKNNNDNLINSIPYFFYQPKFPILSLLFMVYGVNPEIYHSNSHFIQYNKDNDQIKMVFSDDFVNEATTDLLTRFSISNQQNIHKYQLFETALLSYHSTSLPITIRQKKSTTKLVSSSHRQQSPNIIAQNQSYFSSIRQLSITNHELVSMTRNIDFQSESLQSEQNYLIPSHIQQPHVLLSVNLHDICWLLTISACSSFFPSQFKQFLILQQMQSMMLLVSNDSIKKQSQFTHSTSSSQQMQQQQQQEQQQQKQQQEQNQSKQSSPDSGHFTGLLTKLGDTTIISRLSEQVEDMKTFGLYPLLLVPITFSPDYLFQVQLFLHKYSLNNIKHHLNPELSQFDTIFSDYYFSQQSSRNDSSQQQQQQQGNNLFHCQTNNSESKSKEPIVALPHYLQKPSYLFLFELSAYIKLYPYLYDYLIHFNQNNIQINRSDCPNNKCSLSYIHLYGSLLSYSNTLHLNNIDLPRIKSRIELQQPSLQQNEKQVMGQLTSNNLNNKFININNIIKGLYYSKIMTHIPIFSKIKFDRLLSILTQSSITNNNQQYSYNQEISSHIPHTFGITRDYTMKRIKLIAVSIYLFLIKNHYIFGKIDVTNTDYRRKELLHLKSLRNTPKETAMDDTTINNIKEDHFVSSDLYHINLQNYHYQTNAEQTSKSNSIQTKEFELLTHYNTLQLAKRLLISSLSSYNTLFNDIHSSLEMLYDKEDSNSLIRLNIPRFRSSTTFFSTIQSFLSSSFCHKIISQYNLHMVLGRQPPSVISQLQLTNQQKEEIQSQEKQPQLTQHQWQQEELSRFKLLINSHIINVIQYHQFKSVDSIDPPLHSSLISIINYLQTSLNKFPSFIHSIKINENFHINYKNNIVTFVFRIQSIIHKIIKIFSNKLFPAESRAIKIGKSTLIELYTHVISYLNIFDIFIINFTLQRWNHEWATIESEENFIHSLLSELIPNYFDDSNLSIDLTMAKNSRNDGYKLQINEMLFKMLNIPSPF